MAGLELLQAAGAVPGALVLGVEDVARRVHADAAGRADAAAGRHRFAVGRDPQAPAAELVLAGERAGEAEGDPDVAVTVELRAEGVFVVVAVDFPGVADGLEDVGLAVAVGVLDPRQLAALGDVEPAVAVGQAEHLVQPVANRVNLICRRVVGLGVVDQVDLAAAGRDGEAAVGQPLEGAGFEDDPAGDRKGDDPVVFRLLLLGRRRSSLKTGVSRGGPGGRRSSP